MKEIDVIGAASAKHTDMMLKLADFVGAVRIEYEDCGNGENYYLTKTNGESLVLKARGNKVDGGFLWAE